MARPLGESHKRFLQTMMVNGIIDGAKARALHRHCCETHGGKNSIAVYYFAPGSLLFIFCQQSVSMINP